MGTLNDEQHKSYDMGMHTEQLSGRTMQKFFSLDEDGGRFTQPYTHEVDFDKKTDLDIKDMEASEVNTKMRELMAEGYGHIVIKNPLAKHSICVGILNRLKVDIEGSLGYFGCGLIDGPNVRIIRSCWLVVCRKHDVRYRCYRKECRLHLWCGHSWR